MEVDKQAVFEAAMRFIKELVRDSRATFSHEGWSLKVFEEMYMKEYDADMPVRQGSFRLFLDFLGGMFRSVRGDVVLHDLGVGDADVVGLVNGLPVFEVRYFDTHLFSVRRENGLVSSYVLLRGDGSYGVDGEMEVEAGDLFDLTGCLSQVLDGAMSEVSGNGVQNRVVKKYVDGLIRDMQQWLVQPDWCVTDSGSPAFIRNKPIALTWRPSVDGNGILSWSASVGDSSAPVSVNVKGAKGDKGDRGDKGEKGDRGVDGAAGVPGRNGTDGINGRDGAVPEIGDNGNWWIDGADTGKPSRGRSGCGYAFAGGYDCEKLVSTGMKLNPDVLSNAVFSYTENDHKRLELRLTACPGVDLTVYVAAVQAIPFLRADEFMGGDRYFSCCYKVASCSASDMVLHFWMYDGNNAANEVPPRVSVFIPCLED